LKLNNLATMSLRKRRISDDSDEQPPKKKCKLTFDDSDDESDETLFPLNEIKPVNEPKLELEAPDLDELSVTFDSQQSAVNDDTMDYLNHWSAQLRYRAAEHVDIEIKENEISDIVIGTASFYVIQTDRMLKNDVGGELFELLDSYDQEIADLMEILDMHNPGRFKQSFERSCKKKNENTNNSDDPVNDKVNQNKSCSDVVYISRVEINKSMKGNDFGKLLVQRIIDNFGGGQARIVLKPYPLQWEKKYGWNKEDKIQFEKDKKKVRSVWEKMGFEQICDSEFWGRNQSFKHPMSIFE